MTPQTLLRIATVCASVACLSPAMAKDAASAPAKAKATGTPQSHHCKKADGSMDMDKTKKACLADKGTWLKDGAAAAAPAASAPKK